MNILYATISKAVYTKNIGNAIYVNTFCNKKTTYLIKNIPDTHYHKQIDMWEIPTKVKDTFKFVFSRYTIITNNSKFRKEIEKYKKQNYKMIFGNEKAIELKSNLFDHQKKGIQFGRSHPKFLLADDMGLGKTLQASALAISRKHQFKNCLIICGVNGLKWNWEEEIEKHTYEKSHILGVYTNTKGVRVQGGSKRKLEDLEGDIEEFFIITNMASLRNKDILKNLSKRIEKGEIGMTIIDEIHKMKSSQSKVGKAIHSLNSYYKMALTGTPLMNDAVDLYNIMTWLDKEEKRGLTKFKHRYCQFGKFEDQIIGFKNLDELRERLDQIQLRRLRSEVYDLPPKTRKYVYVEMSNKQKKLYTEIKENLISQIDEIVISKNPLAKLTRLRQVTSYPSILDPNIGIGAKMEMVKETVDEIVKQNQKVIIYSIWTDVTDGIMKELQHYNPLEITGNVPDYERQENRRKFQNDDKHNIIVGTVGAMGVGYTLHRANYVIFVDEPWNAANKNQAEDRTQRIGTDHPVTILTFIVKDSIDEGIRNLVYTKESLSKNVVDGVGKRSNSRLAKNLLENY